MNGDGFALDEFDTSQPKGERLNYTIKLSNESEFFLMPIEQLHNRQIEIEVPHDGKHTFKVINIIDSWKPKEGMERSLVVTEI